MNGQYPLNIGLDTGTGFDNFVPGANTQILIELRRASAGEGEPFVYLWGGTGTGKSHLLQAACRRADEQGRRAAYLPLAMVTELAPAVLDGLEQMDLVCLDDIHRAAGKPGLGRGAVSPLQPAQRAGGHPAGERGPESHRPAPATAGPLLPPDLGDHLPPHGTE